MNIFKNIGLSVVAIAFFSLCFSQEAPVGADVSPSSSEQNSMDALKGKISGHIVWSSSRVHSKHDIWIMNADGSNPKALTNSPDNVDWFPRLSSDGKKVTFTRSKSGWVSEMDAEQFEKWDIYTINITGTDEKKVAENATWSNWRPGSDSIVFARGPKVFIKNLISEKESEIFDAESFFNKKKVYAQQPELSPDGNFMAITVRGTKRETGIYNMATNEWSTSGAGCEMSWYPDSRQLIRMNEGQGNGLTEILKFNINDKGEPLVRLSGLTIPKEIRFMDLTGRRSHEYFPRLDQQKGLWMVWCATQYGHEHDIADYEVYLWNTSTDKKKGPVRLTFNTGNDRWPDIYLE